MACQGTNELPRYGVQDVQHTFIVEQKQRLGRTHQSPRTRKVIWPISLINRQSVANGT